ncbi:MAG TPA: hypothetical protein DCW90_15105 [Lachnospiraceae bacterium]|nr:BhlA/UviB family holin-like peptide [uncultured Lachnoclostridium sp.]HAU86764.1 hypothetical protein [Lachnospiraceae bacterium]
MEDVLLSVTQSQGIWTVLFVFLLLYTIKKNDKLDERQEEREREYQTLLSDLTDKYAVLMNMNKQINNLYKLLHDSNKK